MSVDGLIVLAFVAGYLAIVLEHNVSVNKAAAAILTAVACWVLITFRTTSRPGEAFLHLNEHLADISQVIIFLIGAMTIVELINSHDGFRVITDAIRTRNKRVLLWLISLITFFVSAVLDNLTTSIVMVSLLRRLVSDKQDRMIFAAMIILSANAGGAWSPIGDVTTTMLWIDQRISSWKLISFIFVPSLLSLLVPLLYFTFRVNNEDVIPPSAVEEKPRAWGARRVFVLGIGALVFVPVLRALTGLPPYIGILLGMGVMWAVTDRIHQERHYLRVPHVLTKIDMSSVMFFLGILLAVAALETAGLLGQLASWMDAHLGSKDVIICVMGIASAIIDNVPLTAAAMGMYPVSVYPADSKLWLEAAYAVGTGGSLLIIGSAAGVVVMGMEHIRFSWYFKKIALPGLVGYLAGFFAFLLAFKLFG
ncbi:MAG: sodium:proton antiporter NhaD [Candidatus Omnitrophota bacterium]|nr:sodium:proton antiporter NhaD [Candidatus Omnitrophota bacterium]MDZ4241239.1 sodium:proton antiporter NhaD [Candidatus Omnitrophota bacterium]